MTKADSARTRAQARDFKAELELFVLAEQHRKDFGAKTWVRFDELGGVKEFGRGDMPRGDEWVRVEDQAQIEQIMLEPTSWRAVDVEDLALGFERKPRARLSLDHPVFLADGVDRFSAMVIAPHLDHPVAVRVKGAGSGRIEDWSHGEENGATSLTPGESWSFAIVDRRVYVPDGQGQATVVSVDPAEARNAP